MVTEHIYLSANQLHIYMITSIVLLYVLLHVCVNIVIHVVYREPYNVYVNISTIACHC